MKKKFSILTLFVMLGAVMPANAQKIVLQSGDLAFLKGQKNIKLNFVYDGMSVGKFKTEDEYIKNKVEEAEKKEKGKGEKWLDGWKTSRETRYEPKFEELINKQLSKPDVTVSDKADGKYLLTVKTVRTEPGWNIGISKMPSSVDFEYIFTEVSNPDKVLAKLYQRGVPGSQAMGYDFDAGSRIAESYAKAGKSLGGFLVKKAFKK